MPDQIIRLRTPCAASPEGDRLEADPRRCPHDRQRQPPPQGPAVLEPWSGAGDVPRLGVSTQEADQKAATASSSRRWSGNRRHERHTLVADERMGLLELLRKAGTECRRASGFSEALWRECMGEQLGGRVRRGQSDPSAPLPESRGSLGPLSGFLEVVP